MAAKTVDGLIAHCEKALKEKWQYVYGTKGKKTTLAQIQALRRTYGSCCVWPSDDKKAGKIGCDCSGLISSYTGILRGSAQYKSTAKKVYAISKRTSAMRGWAVWMNGHIGIYDGNNGYYAMDGSSRNMVHYPLSRNNFTHIIQLCDIDYGKGTTTVPAAKPAASGGAYNTVSSISATYAVKLANGRTLPFVTNLTDYAGIQGNKIVGLAVKFSQGKCWYRVRCNGKWLPKVTGCNWADAKNGWAGDGKHPITAVQIEIEGSKTAYYHVSPLKKNYYPYQADVQKGSGMDGYAGDMKSYIDRIQIYAK